MVGKKRNGDSRVKYTPEGRTETEHDERRTNKKKKEQGSWGKGWKNAWRNYPRVRTSHLLLCKRQQ